MFVINFVHYQTPHIPATDIHCNLIYSFGISIVDIFFRLKLGRGTKWKRITKRQLVHDVKYARQAMQMIRFSMWKAQETFAFFGKKLSNEVFHLNHNTK